MTLGEIQAQLYDRIKLQGRIRALGRAVSYLVEIICFIGVTQLYMLNKCDTSENIMAIVVTFIYAILIQDQFNTILQILFIAVMGNSGKPEGSKKILKQLILKEVWDLFPSAKNEVLPVNDMFYPNFSQNDVNRKDSSDFNMNNGAENGSQEVSMGDQNNKIVQSE